MWSLPDINLMNSDKHQRQRTFKGAIKTGRMDGKDIPCDSADENCKGEVYVEPFYDIFSDDISGLIAQCEYHRDREGTPEGYFYCDGCNRTMIENITWELYYAFHEGSQLCLPCYAHEVLHEDSNWIDLNDDAAIESVTEKTVRKAPHCIGVRMPLPKGLEFRDSITFDSMDGHGINGGVEDLKRYLRDLKADGYKRAILILDGGYQFASSIGVYGAMKGGTFDVQPAETKKAVNS
jgi:hypothetical protein